MLKKTLAILADVKPGTYLPDDVVCHDAEEIDALGRVLDRLLYRAFDARSASPSVLDDAGPLRLIRRWRRVLQKKFGVTITRADSYGEIPTAAELERSFASAHCWRWTVFSPAGM